MLATNAFGLGVQIKDARHNVHCRPPGLLAAGGLGWRGWEAMQGHIVPLPSMPPNEWSEIRHDGILCFIIMSTSTHASLFACPRGGGMKEHDHHKEWLLCALWDFCDNSAHKTLSNIAMFMLKLCNTHNKNDIPPLIYRCVARPLDFLHTWANPSIYGGWVIALLIVCVATFYKYGITINYFHEIIFSCLINFHVLNPPPPPPPELRCKMAIHGMSSIILNLKSSRWRLVMQAVSSKSCVYSMLFITSVYSIYSHVVLTIYEWRFQELVTLTFYDIRSYDGLCIVWI